MGISKRRGGFTLIEMIVTLAITIVVIGVSASLLISTTNIFGRSALRDQQLNIAETIVSFAAERMMYANWVEETDDITEDDAAYAVLGVDDDGRLLYKRADDPGDPVNIFGSGFYHNYSVSLTYSIIESDSGIYSVSMKAIIIDNRSGSEVLDRMMTRTLPNFLGPAATDVRIGGEDSARFILIG